MSGLKDRLNRLKKPEKDRKPRPAAGALDRGWEDLQAVLEEGEWGSFVKRRVRYPLDHRHGHYELGELLDSYESLRGFHRNLPVDPYRILFFDTETTGLGIGAGNVPFMLGIGYYENDGFVAEQLFIRNPAEESAMLAYFDELLTRFTHLVSYNGRTFDWPIVKNRYVMNRMEPAGEDPAHLDFLYPSRSLWRNTMPSCRLGKVEEKHLGYFRSEDVPGSLAPTLYFQYLAERDPSVMQGVFIHNEQDILSLAGLAIHFSRALDGKLNIYGMEADELYRLGVWLDKMERPEYSKTVLDHLLERIPYEQGEVPLSLAAYLKKKGRLGDAVVIWKQEAERPGKGISASLEPFVELAMFYEHREKDIAAALHYAEAAVELVRRRAALTRMSAKQQASMDSLNKRIQRLRAKGSGTAARGTRRKRAAGPAALTLF